MDFNSGLGALAAQFPDDVPEFSIALLPLVYVGVNLSDRSPEALWHMYVQLTEVEAVFRALKSELALRPIWHWVGPRVEAHVMVAFLGYCLWVCLKQKLKAAAPGLSPWQLSTNRVCLHDRVPSAATRRVHPLQLHELVPSLYCRVSYSMLGLESDAKVQTLVMRWVMSGGSNVYGSRNFVRLLEWCACPRMSFAGVTA